jgi:hypothetical protein
MEKFKCLGQCKQEFTFGEWECFPGQPHEVELKTYYMADAPFLSKHDLEKDPDGISLRNSRTHVHCIPDRIYRDGVTGQQVVQSFQPILFKMGKYETRNPMEQFYLERSKMTVSYERWFEAYHTPKQKQNIKDGKQMERDRVLENRERDLDRREREVNDLLAQVKGNVRDGKPASR